VSTLVRDLYRSLVDERARDAVWAVRTRGDLSVLSHVVRGVLGVPRVVSSTRDHLEATVAWLCAAQDATGVGGVSAFYDVRAGVWGPPYPETTGYIIPTFFDLERGSGVRSYGVRAARMAEWLLGTQLECGAFPTGPLWPDWDRRPVVFDTGQVIHGLIRVFEQTRDARYLEAAVRAGDWLCAIQDPDGSWRRHTSSGGVHTYNVRTAWALLRLSQATDGAQYRRVATRNLEWALAQQCADGWFAHMEFRAGEDPLTHTIAYTIEGLLESGILLSESGLIASARLAADALIERQAEETYLGARYGRQWRRSAAWSCLTGNAQMAVIWFRLYELTGRKDYLSGALSANRHVKQHHVRRSRIAGLAGGVAGSGPIYGGYEPYRNLNWAAKFFTDSLLLEERLLPRS